MPQKKTVLQGALFLTAAGMVGKLTGFFYRILLARAIGADGLGVFQLILPLYALSYALTVSGVQTAVSRLVAAKTAGGDPGGARSLFHCGLIFSLGVSLAVSALLFYFHGFLAVHFAKEPRTAGLLQLMALAIPFGTLHSCINGYYLGLKMAAVPALSEALEHIVRLTGVLLLCRILAAQNAAITPRVAVWGLVLEEAFAALFSSAAITLHFSGQAQPLPRQTLLYYMRELLTSSVPLTLSRVLTSLLGSIETLLIPLQLRLSGFSGTEALRIYGVLAGMALPLLLFPTTFVSPFCAMLLPVTAEAQAAGQTRLLRSAIHRVCLTCLSLGAVCFVLFFCFGSFLGELLFQEPLAGTFIRALAWICPLLCLNPALSSILNGLGKTAQVFTHTLAGVLLRIIFILFAIPRFGISGFFYGILAGQVLMSALSLRSLCAFFTAGA